jgi:glutathione S-transferase
MKLYLLKNGVNPRRVRIFLAEKGVTLPIEEFDMENAGHREPGFRAKNPLATLPVLELDDGTIIAESVAICRYLEATWPEPPLMGQGAVGLASAEMWNRRMEFEILVPAIDAFVHTHPFWEGRRAQIKEYGEARRQHLVERMKWLDGELKDREFIAGDKYGIADITAQVGLLTARGALKLPVPEDQRHLSRWWNAVSARPSARA